MGEKTGPKKEIKLLPSVVKSLEEAFLTGASIEEACFFAEIDPVSLYRYQKANPEFSKKKQAWKQNPIFKARSTVFKELDGNPDMAFKYLERKKKSEFAQKQEIDATGEVILKVVYEDTPKKEDE